MNPKDALIAFLDDPSAAALSELAEELEEQPEARHLIELAARAVYLEDERLQQLLQEAKVEAERLLRENR